VNLTGGEADVLKSEVAKKTLVGWYRNPTGGSAAVGVPYTQSGLARTMYPDFLFFHQVDNEIVVDLVDPHRPSQADTGSKWAGLAEYASKHGELFRRVVAVIKNSDDVLVSVDLKNPSVGAAMQTATTETDIRRAFEAFGGNY
jgi:type III restriction enzyme